jgi:hypothetical protein
LKLVEIIILSELIAGKYLTAGIELHLMVQLMDLVPEHSAYFIGSAGSVLTKYGGGL